MQGPETTAVAADRPAAPAPGGRPSRVAAIIPCFNRPGDLSRLLSDLGDQCAAGTGLRVVIVDNASAPPLTLDPPPGLHLETVRLEINRGGSGGFNAGVAHALRAGSAEFVWLLDSDARLEPGALAALLAIMDRRPEVVIAGSALADPASGAVFELGGFVDRGAGELTQPLPAERGDQVGGDGAREVEYVAACSMLVRREAVEVAGLMADLFVNSDDAEWCLRIARRTGGKVVAVASSVARHPDPDKMRTWARYDVARNCLVASEALGLGAAVRGRRAWREVARALAQHLVGRDDLARLHLRGLEDLRAGRLGSSAPRFDFERPRPLDELAEQIASMRRRAGPPTLSPELRWLPAPARAALAAAGVDLEQAPPAHEGGDVARALVALVGGILSRSAIVSARARPGDWMLGREMLLVAEDGFVVRRPGGLRPLASCAGTLIRGGLLATQLALRGAGAAPLVPPAPLVEGAAPRLSLSIVILSWNRRDALLATLGHLRAGRFSAEAEIIVVDNASSDGSVADVRAQFPDVRTIEMAGNAGVAGFNRGAAEANGDVLLILDDDAWPDADALGQALALLDERPDVGAISLLPRHPVTLRPEWPFARVLGSAARDDWPVMGCGNLVRRESWQRVGGYEESFFLYRNDVDLALKLLGAGEKVWFDPTWVVWHDSPAARRKSRRWFELATRNWIWLARRHGRGASKWLGIALGWANAHRLARASPPSHAAVLRGTWQGMTQRPPHKPPSTGATAGAAWRTLLRARRRRD